MNNNKTCFKTILLIQPPIQDFYLTRKRTIPYGLASIGASLKQKGFKVEIIDALASDKTKPIPFPQEFSHLKAFYARPDLSLFSLFHKFYHFGYSHEHIGAVVREKKPFLVGISSLFSAYSDQALETARIIRKFSPQTILVMGGHHPTVFPKKVLDSGVVDFVLRGEGEQSMPLLCQALVEKTDPKLVPGIAFMDHQDLFIAPPAWIKDISQIPLPLDSLDNKYYTRNNKASITTVSSRGCPMPCSYCSISASSSHAGFRQRKPKDVIQEIENQAKKADLGFIDFEDENLSLNKTWFLSLLDGVDKIFKDKKVELRAMNGLYPPSIDEDIIIAMKKSGFKTLNLSLGSTSGQQLRRFKRPDVRAAHDHALDLARQYNLSCVSYIIAAAPGQSADSSLEDLLYLAQKRTLAGLSIFYPAPGSLDYTHCEQQKILPEKFSLMRSTALPLDNITTRVQAVTLLRLSRILNYMKSVIDNGHCLPQSEPFQPGVVLPSKDRKIISGKLFQWFLHDGIIRGVDNDQTVYEHFIDLNLAQNFVRGIRSIPLTGVDKGPVHLKAASNNCL